MIDVFIQRNSFSFSIRHKFHMANTKRAITDELYRIRNFKIISLSTSSKIINRISRFTISNSDLNEITAVIKENPANVVSFSAKYFRNLLDQQNSKAKDHIEKPDSHY